MFRPGPYPTCGSPSSQGHSSPYRSLPQPCSHCPACWCAQDYHRTGLCCHGASFLVSLLSLKLCLPMLRGSSMQQNSLPKAQRHRPCAQVSCQAGCAEGQLFLQPSAPGKQGTQLSLKNQLCHGRLGQPVCCELAFCGESLGGDNSGPCLVFPSPRPVAVVPQTTWYCVHTLAN